MIATISEGRAAYNFTRIARRDISQEIHMSRNHEAEVEAFFTRCAQDRPAETAEVFAKYPTLTPDQLAYQRAHELHAFGPEEDFEEGDDHISSLTSVASLRVYEAELRGE